MCIATDNTYEVEFTNEDGETLALCTLSPDQFIVIWQARTKKWVPVAEWIAALTAHLPEEAEQQVLDFACFLQARIRWSPVGREVRTGGTVS